MHLVWFLTIGIFLSVILGEFGQIPFGTTSLSISLTDILLGLSLTFLAIWQIGIKRKVIWNNQLTVLSIFYLIGFISLLISGDFSGVFYLLRFMLYSIGFWLGLSVTTEKSFNLSWISTVIVRSSLVFAILGFIQLLIYPDLGNLIIYGFDPHKNRLVSTLLDPNFMGTLLNFGLMFSLVNFLKGRRKIDGFIVLIILVAIILTFSRSAYLMFAAQSLIFGVFRAKRLLMLLVVMGLLLYLLLPPFASRINGALNFDVTSRERVLSWQKGITIWQQSPIIGVGFNNIRTVSQENNLLKTYTSGDENSGAGVDSSLIVVLATTGVVGLLVFLFFWGSVLSKLWQGRADLQKIGFFALLIGLLVNSQFINSLFFPPIMFYIYFLSGLFVGSEKTSS